jgi:hypothetical protein
MPRVSPIRKTRLGVKALRVLARVAKGHRPSTFNACIAGKLKGTTYAKPPAGTGGMRNPAVHKAFVQAAITCGANISAAKRAKWGV